MKKICLFITCLAIALSMQAKERVTWVIDAGHGGHDVGCKGRKMQEKEITLAVAKELGRQIKKEISGVRVVYTRSNDKFLSLQERCNIANRRRADLFISIHVNSSTNQFARGTETFFATNVPLRGSQAGKSELLALLLQKQYLSHGREVSRGVKKRRFYVCEHTNMPCVLTEIGFISNLNEEAYLNTRDGQKELAQAICQALKEWKDLTKGGNVPKRKLRNLRFTHYDPVTVPAAKNKSQKKTKAEVAALKTEVKKTTSKKETKEEVKKKKEVKKTDQKKATSREKTKAGVPYFAIQIANTAKRLADNDYRLKGYKPVKHIPSGGRFKIIYGHSNSYKDIQNELAQVRDDFPEAFIVAFLDDKQITTSEALQLLKK